MFKYPLFLLFTLVFLCPFYGQAIADNTYKFSIEPPVEWKASADPSGAGFLFTSPDDKIGLLLTIEPSQRNTNLEAVLTDLVGKTGTVQKLEHTTFTYNAYKALLGSYSRVEADKKNHGFLLIIDSGEYTYVLSAILKNSELSTENLALIYSALDSFAIGEIGRQTPGPISQFDVPLNSESKIKQVEISFGTHNITLDVSEDQAEAAQRLVEREALVMSRYRVKNELAYLAWIRYYRLIYRDNYTRLEKLLKAIRPYLKNKSATEIAQQLLAFSQQYSYARFTTPSDIIAPYAALLSQQGDCDSSALTYIILLNHEGINAALLLSQSLGHAVAGVLVDTEGSSVEIFGQRYIIAELTTKQSLGTVPLKVANTKDWFPLLFSASKSVTSSSANDL